MKKLLAAALVLAILACFAACQTGNAEPTVPETRAPETTVPETTEVFVEWYLSTPAMGYYTLTAVTRDGVSMSGEEVGKLGCYLHFREDGSGTWAYSGVSMEFQWAGLRILTDSNNAFSLSLDGEQLILHSTSDWVFRYSGTEAPEITKTEFRYGCYAAGSVGTADGEVFYFDTLETANGYLILNEDGTGYLCYDGKEGDITWDDTLIRLGDTAFKYLYYAPEYSADGEPSILVGFPDTAVTVLFHPVEE